MSTAAERTAATRDDTDRRESRFTVPRPECPHPERWTSADIEATEDEVIIGVGGLVRLLQPEYVVETGTHRGFMAAAIGRALHDNGHGRLDTVEIDDDLRREAESRCVGLPVNLHGCDSRQFTPAAPIDFAWFDSGDGTIRFEEFLTYWSHMHDRTIVGFHDVGKHYMGMRQGVLALHARGLLVPIFLPTPRGVALCQVTK